MEYRIVPVHPRPHCVLLPNAHISKQLLHWERPFMTFLLSLDFYKGQEKLDEIFMWFKKLSLLKFNKEVATARAQFEVLSYCNGEARAISDEQWLISKLCCFKLSCTEAHFLSTETIENRLFCREENVSRVVRYRCFA